MTDGKGNEVKLPEGARIHWAVKPMYDETTIEAEIALIHYAAYTKLNSGVILSELALKKFGSALNAADIDTTEIIKEAERISENARGTDIEKAAKRGDAKTAFSLMDNDPQVINYALSRYKHIQHIPVRVPLAYLKHMPKPEHKPNTATVKDISRKAAQAPISIIRTVRSWFRKIEQATRPTDE